eukprot:5580193-Prorocentrum_lima.AAC.1
MLVMLVIKTGTYTVGGKKGATKAGESKEYLVQRAFLKTHSEGGRPWQTCLFKAPLPPSEGKSACAASLPA